MICPRCNTKHSCGCKAKVSSDGTKGCTSCYMKYEVSINKKGTPIQTPPPASGNTAPSINSITYKQGK